MWIVRVALDRAYTFIMLALPILLLSPVVILRPPTDIFPYHTGYRRCMAVRRPESGRGEGRLIPVYVGLQGGASLVSLNQFR
jgi:hypothetical protein